MAANGGQGVVALFPALDIILHQANQQFWSEAVLLGQDRKLSGAGHCRQAKAELLDAACQAFPAGPKKAPASPTGRRPQKQTFDRSHIGERLTQDPPCQGEGDGLERLAAVNGIVGQQGIYQLCKQVFIEWNFALKVRGPDQKLAVAVVAVGNGLQKMRLAGAARPRIVTTRLSGRSFTER